ncbi:MAG: hypothetical protein DMF91_21270, partial [Acidobacteria bacterium]
RFIKAQPGIRFVTATELMTIYADKAMTRSFRQEDLVGFARSVQKDITFQRLDGYTLSAADVFGLLTDAMAAFIERNEWLPATRVRALDGPARTYAPSTGGTRSSSFRWSAFAQAVRDTSDYCRTSHRVPDEVWIGVESMSPADYLATLAGTFEDLASGKTPSDVSRREGHYTADRYVADDSPALWSWPIFPEGFHAPRIMELARLQAWTLKPAVFQR